MYKNAFTVTHVFAVTHVFVRVQEMFVWHTAYKTGFVDKLNNDIL